VVNRLAHQARPVHGEHFLVLEEAGVVPDGVEAKGASIFWKTGCGPEH
jgi:hypothetical protein